MTLKTKVNSVISYLENRKRKRGEEEKGDAGGFGYHFVER